MTITADGATERRVPGQVSAEDTEAAVDAFAERVLGAVLGAQETIALYLGDRLGWYAALARHEGGLTSAELAEATGTDERYAREWLEHQAVAGYLTVDLTADLTAGDGAAASPTTRRYRLPAAHAEVLANPDSPAYMTPIGRFVAATGRQLDALAEAYRTGGGVSWQQFGADVREAQAAANRPLFLHSLGQELLPSVPDIHDRLSRGARVADIGCGAGWSSIGIALAYPNVTVDGFDVDTESVRMAERNAAEYQVADRVSFADTDGAALGSAAAGSYDLVFAFECIHDMSDPVAVLAAARRLLADGGYMIVMDERAEETFTAPGSEVERLLYGYSITCCLPDGLSHRPSVGTGTVMRPDTLAGYAAAAGFSRTEVLDIEHDFFRFYRLIP